MDMYISPSALYPIPAAVKLEDRKQELLDSDSNSLSSDEETEHEAAAVSQDAHPKVSSRVFTKTQKESFQDLTCLLKSDASINPEEEAKNQHAS